MAEKNTFEGTTTVGITCTDGGKPCCSQSS